MSYPTLNVYIAFSDGPYVAAPTWTDVTTYVRSATVRRGKDNDNDPFSTGTASVVLDNIARRFDPFNTFGPYYGNLIPRRQIKLEATVSGTAYAVFRGFVSGWPVEYTESGNDSTVTLDCFDLFGLMASNRLPNTWASATYLFDDPASATSFAAVKDSLGNPSAAPLAKTAGTSASTKYDSLAAGIESQSTHIGKGNTYKSTYPNSIGFNNLGNISVAFWWAPDTPGVVSNPVRVNAKGGQLEFTVLASGALRVRRYGTSSYYEATSTTTPLVGFAPHYLAATFGGAPTIKIYIDGVDVSGATTNTALSTTLTDGLSFEVNDDIIQALVASAPNSSSVYSAADVQSLYSLSLGSISETTAARFNRYMSSTGISSSLYSATSAPEATVYDLDTATDVNEGLQKTAISEGGDIYVSKTGVLTQTYRSYAAAQAAGTSAATFTDNGGAGLTYGPEMSIYADTDNSLNDITVNFSQGGNVRGSNTVAQTTSGIKAGAYDTNLLDSDQAAALMIYHRNIDATIVPRISPLNVSTNTSNSAWATLLGLELLNKFTVTRTPPTGSAYTTTLLLQSIEHEILPDRWNTRISGTARYNGWFVLGTSALDGPDLLLG